MAVDEFYKHSDVTDKIIGAYYNVYNTLGYGFLEKVYENAMIIELQKAGLVIKAQYPIKVHYHAEEVGVYFADLIVNEAVIIELKSAEGICEEHEAQLINYLKATNMEIGMLLNFGKKAQFKKKIFSNEYKKLNKDVKSN